MDEEQLKSLQKQVDLLTVHMMNTNDKLYDCDVKMVGLLIANVLCLIIHAIMIGWWT